MKKSIIAAGLATALATTSFAGNAMAFPYHHDHRHFHRHHADIGPAIVAGTIFAMIGAALANSFHHPDDGYYGPRSHVAWCEDHYRTYNPATNMFYARPGVREYCHSPYD